MGFHLSRENEQYLTPVLTLLENSKGNVELPTTTPTRLVYLLRSAANTKYTFLKRYIFRVKSDHVLAVLKYPILEIVEPEVPIYELPISYLELLQYLTDKKPLKIQFTNIILSEKEQSKLKRFCESQEYSIEFTDTTLTVSKNG